MVTMEFDARSLLPWIQRTEAQTIRCARMAGSSALRAMKAEASRQIRERKAIKAGRVSKALSTISPRVGDPLVWTLKASSTPLPLIAFGARQTKRGVSIVAARGTRTVLPGTFIATMPRSGHTGVFERTGSYGRVPTKPSKRNPKTLETIQELKGGSIADTFREVSPAVAEKGRQVFTATFRRLLLAPPRVAI